MDDFGLGLGATINRIWVLEDDSDSAELAGAGAHNVPEPSSFVALVSIGAMGLFAYAGRRRRRST